MSEVLNDLLEGKVTSNEVVNWITGSVSLSTLLLSIPCKIHRQNYVRFKRIIKFIELFTAVF